MCRRPSVLFVEASELWGAPERRLCSLLASRELRSRVDAVVAVPGGEICERFVAAGVSPVFPIPALRLSKSRGSLFMMRRLLNIQSSTFALVSLIRRFRPEILHANSLHAAIYSALASRLTRTPFIWHMRDILPQDWTNRRLVSTLSVFADRAFVVSKPTGQALIAMGVPGRKIRVVHNGSDPRVWDPERNAPTALRRRLHIPLNDTVVMHIGRITHWKGQHLFLQAARQAHRAGVLWLLVGGPGDRPEDKGYACEIQEQLKALGPAARHIPWMEQPQDAYAVADLVVHTSVAEDPLPTVLLEAMSFGKPVIASDLGGPPEIVEDGKTGLLFSPERPDQLVAGINRLIGDRELRVRMGQAGRERFLNCFTLSNMVERLHELYLEMRAA